MATISHERKLLADPDADWIFLCEVTPSGGATLRVSDLAYTTEAGDTPASTPWAARLLSPYNVEIRIPAPDSGDSLGSLVFGLVEIEDADRELDALLSESWEGRELRIDLVGTYDVGMSSEHANTYDERVTLIRATVDRIGWEQGRIILTLRELHQSLSQPLQPNTYDGTGGLNGGEALAGVRRPTAHGEVFNVAPTLVDPGNLIYQWHDGQVHAVDAVRDSGVLLAFDADVADITTATPGLGEYATSLATGYIKLGGNPAGLVTLDGRGSKAGGIYVSDTASIVHRIAEDQAGLADPDDFESGSFGGFPHTAAVGYYTGGREQTSLEAITELMRGADGWVSTTRAGRLRIGAYLDPDTTGEAVTLTDALYGELSEETDLPPAWRVEVRYAPNWSPQDKDGLAGAVSAENRELYSQAYRTSAVEDASVKTTHKDARVHVVQTYLRNKADADAFAAMLLARLKVRRRTFRVAEVDRQVFQRQPGDVVRLATPDCGLSAGKNFYVTEVSEVAASRSNGWGLWG